MLRLRFALLAALGVAAALVAPLTASAQEKAVVTVYAAASLKEAFEAAGPAFTAATGYPVRFSYGGSDTLATQLIAGAPADVFASANEAQMQNALDAKVVTAPHDFAHNHLVIIVPKNGTLVTGAADLTKHGVKVVLAAPTVPIGKYARTTFETLAKNPSYGAAYPARVVANVVDEELDVKAVATKVSLGEADAGIVYATDVAPLGDTVRTIAFPAGTAPEATYPIAAVTGSRNAAGAKAFIDFITSPKGTEFLRARGFAP